MTVQLGVFLWTKRRYVDGNWTGGANKLHLAAPHYVHAGYPTDLFDEPDNAPEYRGVLSAVADCVAADHPAGAVENHAETDQGTHRKLGEAEIGTTAGIRAAEESVIVNTTFDPCSECLHHADARNTELEAPEGHHGVTYECEADGDTVRHLGFGHHD